MSERNKLSKWMKRFHVKASPETDPENSSQGPSDVTRAESSNRTELFGLFEFPPRIVQTEYPPSPPFSNAQCVDIVAVHGLGGSWRTTWSADKSDDASIWLRDRLPGALARINVRPRIRAFGYDANYIFTSSTSDAESCAEDLLTRIRVARQTSEERQAPIIFVAHSLGGLIVKLAINIAHTDNEYHHDVLDKTTGCLFLGVPFHGADAASWAQLGSKIVSAISVGVAGNQGLTSGLTKNSKDWMRISRDFVQRGKEMTFRSAYETEKIGRSRIVDESSVRNNVPNERVFPMPGSNHRNICKFSDHEDERFAPIGLAMTELVQAALDDQNLKHLIISELPVSTPKFYGRSAQLEKLTSTLSPANPGRNGVVLFGIGGSGKTQLALQYAKREKQLYKAVIWINAYTSEQIAQSFMEAFRLISNLWPAKDLPNPYRGSNEQDFVLARLRSTLHRNWLLVIDSADDLENQNLVRLIPDCTHGSIIITSTRKDACDILEQHGFSGLEIDKLDDSSGKMLLLDRAGISNAFQGSDNAMAIVKELNGLPLVLEQAGILLKRKIANLDNFVQIYHRHYNELMGHTPKAGEVQHDKTRSIYTILSMLHSYVKKESPSAAAMMRLLAFIGPAQIPLSILEDICQFDYPILKNDPEFISLRDSSRAAPIFRLHLNLLEDVCLVKSRPASTTSPESVLLHRAICQWVTNLSTENKDQWIIFTALGLCNVLCQEKKSLDWPMGDFASDSLISRACLAWVDHISALIKGTIASTDLQPPTGRFSYQYASISRDFGYIYFCSSRFEESKKFLFRALEHEVFRSSSQGDILDNSLQTHYCLGVSYFKTGQFDLAKDSLRLTLDEFPEKTSGENDIISEMYKRVLQRDHVNQRHHSRAVTASNGPKFHHHQDSDTFRGQSSSREIPDTVHGQYNPRKALEELIFRNMITHSNQTIPLAWAVERGQEALIQQLQRSPDPVERNYALRSATRIRDNTIMLEVLIKHGTDLDGQYDQYEQTALHYACLDKNTKAVRFLLDHNVNVNATDILGWTPLHNACSNGNLPIVRHLLNHGANIDAKAANGSTPLQIAIEMNSEDVINFLRYEYSRERNR